MARAAVDAGAMVVRDGGRALAFTADVCAGTAVLDPDGAPTMLRTLHWGEKCALARFASAGAGFVERQFLAACATGSAADTRDATLALLFWLHDPDGIALPLDPRLLATVTAGLCERFGVGPSALADRPAPEIEALWQVQATARTAEPPPDDATRIVIEPDPEMSTQQPASDAAPIGTAAHADMNASATTGQTPEYSALDYSAIDEEPPMVTTLSEPSPAGRLSPPTAAPPRALQRAQQTDPFVRAMPSTGAAASDTQADTRFAPAGITRHAQPLAPLAGVSQAGSGNGAPTQAPQSATHAPVDTRHADRLHLSPTQPHPAATPPDPRLASLIAFVSRPVEPDPEPGDDESAADAFAADLADAAASVGIARTG